MWITENWDKIVFILTSLIAVASVIARITPNETDNKYVAIAQKGVDFLAMSTGKTEKK